MGIFKQEGSDFYYLKFEKDGKQYKRSTECADIRKAKAWDTPERRRAIVNEAGEEVEAEARRNAAEELARIAEAKRFDFERALEYYLAVSTGRKEKQTGQVSNYWRDFAAWAENQGIKTLDQLAKGHAAAYLAMLTKSGRYGDSRPGMGSEPVSARTRNAYHINLKAIFTAAMEPAEITKNPFDLPKVANDSEERDAFELGELKAILDDVQDSPQLRPLVIIAACTGLRRGDACLLEWQEVDLRGPVGFIRKKTSKTGKAVSIPIMDPLRRLLEELQASKDESGFVCPVLASQYQRNRTKISKDFAAVLDRLGIERRRQIDGHSRPHVFKDLHSFRHTFIYLSAERGIPLAIVQGIVGHMTPAMTLHYANHATDKAKAEAMKKLPDFFESAKVEAEAEILPNDAQKIRAALAILKKVSEATTLPAMRKAIAKAITELEG